MFKAKFWAVVAAVGSALLAAIKILTLQRDAAREDARRAKAHLQERDKIVEAEKVINERVREEKAKAVEAIKNGEMPDNIRDRNNF